MTNLYPDEERTVMFRDESGSSARSSASARVTTGRAPCVVTLEPLATITGRVVDADGNPVSGATIRPDLLPER